MSMDIYLMRHGETEWNRIRRLQGITDIPLNENGITEAKRAAEGLRDVPFDRIYTSPLIRAKQTAEIVRGNRSIEIIETEGLKEISFGEYEGLICQKEGYNIPDPNFPRFFEDPEHYRTAPGGESIRHLRERTLHFFRGIMEDPRNEGMTFLMTTHGAAIRGILSGLQELPLKEFWNGRVHRNCGVTKIHVEDGNFQIEFENKSVEDLKL
ncbi:MAG: histidine phosphatase family protein [Lachnospiraceae bacterium]|nr:histidine phosphatase family protein [Lachnospiraceae bacterium]